MNLIKTSLTRPIGTCILFLALIVFGIISISKLKISLLPELNYPKLTVITLFQNVPPKETENLVTAPIEEALMSVKGVKRIKSISRQGISVVIPVFRWGTNIDIASINVREKLDMIKNLLPDDITKPVISRIDPSSSPIIGLGVFSENTDSVFIKKLIEKEIKPELERINGVAKVSVKGGVDEEITVAVDLDKLNAYDISLQQIVNYIGSATYDFPAGNIVEGKKEFLIRVDGEFKTIDDIKNTVIGRSKAGAVVSLSDLADVYSGTKERTSYFLLDGNEGIGLEIMKEANANDIDISKNIKKELVKINDKFASVLKLDIIYDSSDFIKNSINNLFVSAILAIIITFLVVMSFMRSIKLPLIIIITVPVCIIMTFIFMFLSKMSINIMSLGGLVLGIGIVVDSATVIIEEIEGKTGIDDIYSAVKHVSLSIIASTLTTMVVFVPLIFVQGIAGSLFGQLGLTISFSLLSSVIVALFLIPVLYVLIAKGEKSRNPVWFIKLKSSFKKYQLSNLRNKKTIIFVSSCFFIMAVIVFLLLKKEFMPSVDTRQFFMKITYKNGTPIEESKKYTSEITDKLSRDKNILHTFSSIGYDDKDPFNLLQDEVGVHIAEIRVLLKNNRSESVFRLVDRLSKEYKFRDDINIVYEIPRNIIADVLNLDKSDFSVEIFSQDKEKLDDYAERYKTLLEKTGLFSKLESSKKEGKPQIRVSFDNEALAGSGISSKTIYDIMSTGIKGSKAAYFRKDDDQIDIKVILRESDRSEFSDISRLNINTEEGMVPIFPFIKNEKLASPSKILRNNQKEYIKYTGNFITNNRGSLKKIQDISRAFMKKNHDVTITGGDEKKETDESFMQLLFAFLLSLFLVYAILASQFESLLRPFLIMFTVPLAFFGSFFILFIFGFSLNLNSIIGIVMLTGIVVNNGIILFDKYNYNIKTLSYAPVRGIYFGTLNRLKPVLNTTATTIIGLIPMVISFGSSSNKIQASLALTVMGGLAISTVLTLFLMPNLYHLTHFATGNTETKIFDISSVQKNHSDQADKPKNNNTNASKKETAGNKKSKQGKIKKNISRNKK